MIFRGSCFLLSVLVFVNVHESHGSMSVMMKSAMAMIGAEPCVPVMDQISAKAENIKSNIFRYCDQRCKKSGEFHGSDLVTGEMKSYIERLLKFIFGRLTHDCWGLDDMLGKSCPDKGRAALFESGKYKSKKNAVEACQKKVNVKVIMDLFNSIWKDCVAGSPGKEFRALKKLCEVDSKKDPAKKAFDNLSKCIQDKAMPLVMKMTDCGAWAGAFCETGKPKIDKVCDDYMIKWFKTPCMDWLNGDTNKQINGMSYMETASAKICPKGFASDSKKVKVDCAKNSPSY